jgi:hypothetical protein
MEQVALDDFEQRHPPSAALDYLLSDVVCDLVPDDSDTGFGQSWVDNLVVTPTATLPGRGPLGPAGGRPDRDGYLVTWLAQVDQRPRAELLRDGIQALDWLRNLPVTSNPRHSHRF